MKYYICKYCFKEFEPTRRRVQKYCSNTCRSKAYHERQTHNSKEQKDIITTPVTNTTPVKTKIDSLSAAGVGQAAIGTLAADGLKSLFTPLDKKTATKGDIVELTRKLLNRYHLVKSLPPRIDGARPYFDIETNEIVYSFLPL